MKRTTTNNQELWPFWEYGAEFPFILGGHVECFESGGKVSVHGYQGFLFKPILILPLEDGRALDDEIKELSKLRDENVESLEKKCAYELAKIMPNGLTLDRGGCKNLRSSALRYFVKTILYTKCLN